MSSQLTDEEIEMYGPEFVEIMRKVAAEQAAPLNNEIQNLRGQLGFVQQEAGTAFMDRMDRELTAIVGDWQTLNRHPPFISWSKELDVFSGRPRAELMQHWWNAGDAQRVAAFFQAWAALPDSRPPPRSGYNFLPSGPPQARSVGNTYTPDQISRFYRDVTAGRWANRERERIAIDHDIILAQREGRVVDSSGRPISGYPLK